MKEKMITEDYVSFETAKLMKEKGFDEKCSSVWRFTSNSPNGNGKWILYGYNMADEYSIWNPTFQMAMKWLREVYKILILVEYDCPVFSSDIYKMDDIDEYGSAKHISPTFANCKNYEQACESAIKYCLENLI